MKTHLFTLAACFAFAMNCAGQATISIVAGNGTIFLSNGDGGPATSAAVGAPVGVAADASGNVFIADLASARIRKVDAATGIISTYAGGGSAGNVSDGPATSAGFVFPANSHAGVAVDRDGNVYIADPGDNRVRKVNTSGVITTLAGAGGLGTPGFSGDGGPATAAKLQSPDGVALDAQGNVYIADTGNGRIRKVDLNGVITTVAGRGNSVSSTGDNGPALNAQFNTPTDVAVDPAGNIYIADFGNHAIRKVDKNGTITTILRGGFGVCPTSPVPAAAADIGFAVSIATDANGNLFIASENMGCVLMMEPNGIVSTFAGGGNKMPAQNIPATSALLGSIWGVNTDPSGNVYITNSLGYVHKVTPAATPPSSLPVITSVVNGASFAAGIAPNTWVTIRGSNLAPKTDLWNQAIKAGVLPTSLDNVSVTIASRPVYVEYISQTQLNVLTPPDLDTGILPVIVTTPAGPSASFSVVCSTYMPALFMWPNGQPVATHADFTWAVKNGTFPGTTTIPAKPGETIILWATGLGPTSPPAPVGVEVSGQNTTTSLPSITLLTTPAVVYGAALAPGFAGLYQIAFQVPDFPDGDYPINGTVAGVPFLGAVNLTIHK